MYQTFGRAKVLKKSRTSRLLNRVMIFSAMLTVAFTYSRLSGESAKMAAEHAAASDPFRSEHSDFRQLATVAVNGSNATNCSGGGSSGGGHGSCELGKLVLGSLNVDFPGVAIALFVLGMLFVFLGIAIICDDHFCVALEVICDVLELDEAVAGATFMAAGGSAPELATSLITTFGSRDSTGLGTILGSAVFNLVVIISLSGMKGEGPDRKLKPMPFMKLLNKERRERSKSELPDGLFLDWRPLMRDAFFYILSIILCIYFALTDVGTGWCKDGASRVADGEFCKFNNVPGFTATEGWILLGFYALYIASMVVNDSIMRSMRKLGMPDHIAKYVDACAGADPFEDAESRMEKTQGPAVVSLIGNVTSAEHDHRKRDVVISTVRHHDDHLDSDIGPPPANGAPVMNDQVDMKVSAVKDELGALKSKVAELESNQREMMGVIEKLKGGLQPLVAPTLYEYKLKDQEEKGIIDYVVGAMAMPWQIAFGVSIPACDRDSFQMWEEDKPEYFSNFDDEMQKILTAYCRKTDRLSESEDLNPGDMFYPGKRTSKDVTLSYERSKKYLVTFTMSIFWIIVASYIMVECAHGFGCHVGIPPFVMGVVVLAAGTSIPDALASMVVAEQGDGDMAVANAIGSNVFDICIGMGMPLVVSEMVYKEPYPVMDTLPAATTGSMLIIITVVLVMVLVINKWILTKNTATFLLSFYVFYVLFAVLFEWSVLPLYSSLCVDEVNTGHPCFLGSWQSCKYLKSH